MAVTSWAYRLGVGIPLVLLSVLALGIALTPEEDQGTLDWLLEKARTIILGLGALVLGVLTFLGKRIFF